MPALGRHVLGANWSDSRPVGDDTVNPSATASFEVRGELTNEGPLVGGGRSLERPRKRELHGVRP